MMRDMEGGSPPRSWQAPDSRREIDLHVIQNGQDAAFFGQMVPETINHLDMLHLGKLEGQPDEIIWQTMQYLHMIPAEANPDLKSFWRVGVAAASTRYQEEFVAHEPFTFREAEHKQQVLRAATKFFEDTSLLVTAIDICKQYPTERNKAVEGTVRLLLLAEHQQLESHSSKTA